MTAPAVLGWLVEALVASGLLMVAVLLVRVPVRRSFGPQVAYALWALPALRLLLPPLPADVAEQAAMPISAAGEAMEVLILPADGATIVAPPPGLPWGTMVLAAWALGTIAFLAIQVGRHRRFCARLLHEACVLDEIDGIRVIESAATIGPVAFGLRPRFVAFPCDFAERYDADERAFALLHELGHHRARDLLSNWAALGVLALHWFNPLAWHAFRAFRGDQELANDARVLAGRSRTDAHIYACAILKAAHGGHVPARAIGACHLHTIADLKGRMRMLTRNRPSRRRLAMGTTAVAALVAAGLGLTASGTRAAAAVSTRIGDAVGVDLADQVAPIVPAVPAPATTPSVPAVPAAPARPATKAVKRIVVVKNGEAKTYTGVEADAYAAAHPLPVPPLPPLPPAVGAPATATLTADGNPYRVFVTPEAGGHFTMVAPPQMAERACVDGVDGGSRQLIVTREEKGKRMTIICRNRLDAVARNGMRMGLDAAARGRWSALGSIRSARASIVADRNLSDEQRRNALAGLDKAQAELSSRD